MNKLSLSFRSLRLRLGRRISYDLGSGDPSFNLQGLGVKGMKVSGVESKYSKEAVVQLLEIWGGQEAPSVVMTISARKGIRILDKKGTELVSYKIHDIAYCSVDAERDDIFVFIGNRTGDNDARCHAFFCGDTTKAQALCLTMAHAFDVAFRNWKKQQKTEIDINGNAKTERRKSLSDLGRRRKSSRDGDEVKSTGKGSKRRSSTQSNLSTFSYDSNTSEAFRCFDAVEDGFDDDLPLLLRQGGEDWEEIAKNEAVQSQLFGDEILWENGTSQD